MECMRGKKSMEISALDLARYLNGYHQVWLDLGTGDGRFVQHVARTQPDCFVIGVDACRENLREQSRKAWPNALYVVANAQALPRELHGLAGQITVNFPWGSLLEELLAGEPGLLNGLAATALPGARLDVRLNAGALAEAGWSFEEGGAQVRRVLRTNGFDVRPLVPLTAHDLRVLPTTWAKRLAFGRDPRAVYLGSSWQGSMRARSTRVQRDDLTGMVNDAQPQRLRLHDLDGAAQPQDAVARVL